MTDSVIGFCFRGSVEIDGKIVGNPDAFPFFFPIPRAPVALLYRVSIGIIDHSPNTPACYHRFPLALVSSCSHQRRHIADAYSVEAFTVRGVQV